MKTVWPNLQAVGLNTVLAPMPGLDRARRRQIRLHFRGQRDPGRASQQHAHRVAVVRKLEERAHQLRPDLGDGQRRPVPRAQLAGGKTVEVLSTLSEANWTADAKAFAAFMRHIKEGDDPARTTIMVQLENEVGLLGDSRDRSALANEAFAKPVPKELTIICRRTRTTCCRKP